MVGLDETQFLRGLFSLSGRVALVTGGGRGLGATLAEALARAGATVAITGRSEEDLLGTVDRLRAFGAKVLAVAGDVTRLEWHEALVDRVEDELGPLDVLVNNAGTNIPKPVFEVSVDDWDTLWDLNVKSLFFLTKVAARRMIERGYGRIIHISSQMGAVGAPNRSVYCGTKGAVAQFTRAMAVEWAKTGVTVNAIAPTFIDSPLARRFFEADPAFYEDVVRRIPMGRVGQPEELMGAVVYLASESSSLVTGHVLFVDGGWTAW